MSPIVGCPTQTATYEGSVTSWVALFIVWFVWRRVWSYGLHMRTFLVSVGLFLFGCATTQASEVKAPPKEAPAVPPKEPQKTAEERKAELLALFPREISARPQQTFALADQSVTVESATPVHPKVNEGAKSVQLELGLGTSQPVTCYLYERGIDVGSLATRMAAPVTGDTTVKSEIGRASG